MFPSHDQVGTDGGGHLKVTLDGSTAGQVEIKSGINGQVATVDSTNRLLVSTNVTAPVGTTEIIQTEYSDSSGTQDSFYTITNGETLTLTRFSAGAASSTEGSVIELYYAPNGNTTGLEIIDVIFAKGSSDQHDLLQEFVGDGTRAILLRRERLDGGSRLMFGRWEGFES